MNLKAHAAYGVAIVLALIALVYYERRAGAAEARAHATADSLAQITASLRLKADSALAHQRQDSITELQRVAAIRARDAKLVLSGKRQDSLQTALRAALPDSGLRARFDSLTALAAQRESSLVAAQEAALILFRHAAAQRDTLAGLVRQLQVQQQGLSTALAQASRKPIWEQPALKLVEASLAVYGAARLLGR